MNMLARKIPPIRELTMTPVSIFAPKARDCPHKGTCDTEELCDGYRECKLDHTSVEAPRGPDLQKLEEDMSRNRRDEIAAAVRALTYGEMIEFAKGLWGKLPELPEGGTVKPEDFPTMLHEWSVSHGN